MDRGSPRRWNLSLVAVPVLAGLFAIVAWRSVRHVNTQWDELNDHLAALALLEHPLWGSGIDGSQARLPMYVTAGAYAWFGPSLSVARGVSILVGAVTIVVTYLAGRRWFGRSAGLLAAGLLAFSPYFMGFSRTALTEGDAFCPLTVLLTVLAFHGYLCRRDTPSVLILGATLGIALAAKFYTILLVPPLLICDWLQYRAEPGLDGSEKRVFPAEHQSVAFWAIAALLFPLVGMAIVQGYREAVFIAELFWLAGLSFLVQGAVRFFLIRRRPAEETAVWPVWRAWLAIPAVAVLVCLVLFPEHVIQREVPRALVRRLIRQDHVLAMTTFIDPVRLYGGIILLKLGLPLGLLTVAALVWAWVRSPHEPVVRVLLAVVGLYVLLLTTLPVRQSFYLMSVYPLLVLMLSAFIVRAAHWLRDRERVRSAWIAVVVISCGYLLWGVVRVYPDFGLYGYETIGDRWLGAESRGYRNLIQVTNDGTEDALRWCTGHVPPGQRVVSYLWDDHVIDAFFDHHPPAFELVRRLPQADPKGGPAVEDADFLLVGVNNQVTYRDMPPAEQLADRFRPEPVHTVWRGRGVYRVPVVRIYERQRVASAPSG